MERHQGQNRAVTPTTCVLPSFPSQIEASKLYNEAIQQIKDMKQPVYLTLQEGNQGAPSRADITSILGSDHLFFTIEYIKHGKRHVTILSDDRNIYKATE